jgi:DNA-binding XRE family transcriptional regulator
MTQRKGVWSRTNFGVRLKQLREAAGISQQELATRAECSLFTISKIERGTQEPAWPLALALARALAVSVAAFDDQGAAPSVTPTRPVDESKADTATTGGQGRQDAPGVKPITQRGKRKGGKR